MSQHLAHRHVLFGLFGILQVGKFNINIWSNGLSLFELSMAHLWKITLEKELIKRDLS